MSNIDNETFTLTPAQVAYRKKLIDLVLAAAPLAGGALQGEGLTIPLINSIVCRTFLDMACATAYQNALACDRAPDRDLWLRRCGQAFDAIASAEAEKQKDESGETNEKLIAKFAQAQGFSGDACARCGNFTLKRAGTCLTCQTCGETSGCS